MSGNVAFEKQAVNSLYSEKNAPRKNLSDLKKGDNGGFNKMQEELKKSKDLVVRVMLEESKNIDPFGEDGNNVGKNMADSMLTIAELDSAGIQGRYMEEMVNAQKNSLCSPYELQGAEIGYDDAKRIFDGKNPVEFNYELNYDNNYEGGIIKTTVTIKDSDGKVVATAPASANKGDNIFTWDGLGKGNRGSEALMPIGEYTIEVKATGSKGGSSFPVNVVTNKTDVVQSVEIENQMPTKLHLKGGRVIEYSQFTQYHGKTKEAIPDVKAEDSMLEKKVTLDFSKAFVKNGSMQIHYDNTVENQGNVKISLMDSTTGLDIKTIYYQGKLNYGEGQITLKDEIKGLQDGKYKVSITVEDITDPQNTTQTQLKTLFERKVKTVGKDNNTIIDDHKREYSAELIKLISSDFMSPFEYSRANYIGKEIEFAVNEIPFGAEKLEFTHNVQKSEADGLPFITQLWVRDTEGELVDIVNNYFNPIDMATTEAAEGEISGADRLREKFNTDFVNIDEENQDKLYKEAFQELLSSPEQYIKAEYRTEKSFSHKYSWDGKFDSKRHKEGEAKEGEIYRVEVQNTYINASGDQFKDMVAGPDGQMKVRDNTITDKGIVSELSQDEFGNVTIILEDGSTVPGNKIVSVSENPEVIKANEEAELKRFNMMYDMINSKSASSIAA